MNTSDKRRIEETLAQVISECWQNEDFKTRLVASPLETIKEIDQNFSIPHGKTLIVRDQTAEKTLYVNIPAQIEVGDIELSDKQLESVAGGTSARLTTFQSEVYKDYLSKFLKPGDFNPQA